MSEEEKIEDKIKDTFSAAEVNDLQEKLNVLNNLLQKRHYELEALKSLSSELSNVAELWQAVDLVSGYLWEIIDYSVAAYVIFDQNENALNSRVYLKEAVNEDYLVNVKKTLIDYVAGNAQPDVALIAKEYIHKDGQLEMKRFGISVGKNDTSVPNSGFIIPLGIGEKTLGAMYVSSSKMGLYDTNSEQEIVHSMASIASISIARLQELISSQRSMNESLVESLNNGVIMFNDKRKIILMNPAAQKMTGLMHMDYSVTELFSLFSEIALESMINEAIREGKIIHIEEVRVSQFFYEMYISPVRDFKKRIVGGAIIIHDVTRIKEVDRMKTDFVSIASHQLRTPLTAISWYTEMLQSGDAGELNEKQTKYLLEVHKGSVKMTHLINDLLNISRLETGRLRIEPVKTDLVRFIVEAIHDLEIWIEKRKRKVVFENRDELSKLEVLIDPTLMHQVIHNLITNAVRYSTEIDSIVRIFLEEKDDEYIISVVDEGIGIPKESQNKIFQKFFRADNARSKEGDGSGIGLYIAKMIMEASSGRLWFDSPTLHRMGVDGKNEDYGTIFYVAIPKTGMISHEGEKSLSR
jgi:PAS domain S-box-containing protein